MAHFHVRAPPGGLSDFADSAPSATVGQLGVLVNDESVVQKRRQVLIQLVLSLVLTGSVLALVARLLRARLIQPIQHINSAMEGLSKRNYDAPANVPGNDELARLAVEVNRTIQTVAAHTRELERHRNDAERALQDADEANLAREGLVRTLTEELEEPLNRLHSQLTAIAIANQDPTLKEQIKHVLVLLQEAQANFADLIELASSTPTARRPAMRELAAVLAEVHDEIRALSQAEIIPITLMEAQPQLGNMGGDPTRGIYVDLDGARLRKALSYLIRAMVRRCKPPGVYVSTEVIWKSHEHLHLSLHLRGFYDPSERSIRRLIEGVSQYASTPPLILGWTERETRMITYLLRTVGITPMFGAFPEGAVSVLLDVTCTYVERTDAVVPMNSRFGMSPVSASLVSDDPALSRLTTRADLADFEVAFMSFEQALVQHTNVRFQSALLIDVSDIAAALGLLELLKGEGALPPLIAICPPGHVSDALSNRLFELGFTALVQKPLQYSRVVQIIRTALADPLSGIRRGAGPINGDGGSLK
jgi:HAMP domain-containing protein